MTVCAAADGRETEGRAQDHTYDALVVCNGHYSAPRCPDVEGSETFPGTVMHSHNYRVNEAFKGQVVVLVGASASGEDICREIAEVADKVHAAAVATLSLCHTRHMQGLYSHQKHPVTTATGCLRCVQGLSSAMPYGMIEPPHSVDCYSLSFPVTTTAALLGLQGQVPQWSADPALTRLFV